VLKEDSLSMFDILAPNIEEFGVMTVSFGIIELTS
jgi:hypothetical protein